MDKLLTKSEILELVDKWFKQLDLKASLDEFAPLLDEEKLVMEFPEGTLKGVKDFSKWLSGAYHTFFDTKHTPKEVEIALISPNTAKVNVIVNWQARRWEPPSPKSEYLNFDAHQKWIVKLSPRTGKATISEYVVESLEKQP